MTAKTKGYILGAVAAATYGMNPLFAIPLYRDGMNTDSVLFFRYLFALPVLAIMIKARGRDFRIGAGAVPFLALFGILFGVSSLTLFLSYRYMDAGIASTLLFVYPVLVAIIMAAVFGERLPVSTVAGIAVAVSGIAMLYKGAEGAALDLTGTLLVAVSALSYALYIVGINQSRLKDMPTLKVTFYVSLFGLSVFIAGLVLGEGMTLPGKWYLWGNLLALGLFPTAISLLCTTAAVHYVGSTPTAILGALEPVTAVFFGVTIFGERLTPRNVAGIVLIIAAVGLVVAGGTVAHHLVSLRKMFPRLRKPGKR